jgi:hypothetical protein
MDQHTLNLLSIGAVTVFSCGHSGTYSNTSDFISPYALSEPNSTYELHHKMEMVLRSNYFTSSAKH